MNLLGGVWNGLLEIWAHKLRSALTMLCVLLGVASLVITVGFVDAMFRGWETSLRERGGLERITVQGKEPPSWQATTKGISQGLTEEDAEAIMRLAPHIGLVAPEIEERMRVEFGDKEMRSRVMAGTADSLIVSRFEVERGREFSKAEEETAAAVIILGTAYVEQLFAKEEDPIGKFVTINNRAFRVVGVLRHYESFFGRFNALRWKNDIAIIPLKSMQARIKGRRQLSRIAIRISDLNEIGATVDAIENILTLRHRGILDFEVTTSESDLAAYAETRRNYGLFATGIGTVSLLVSGIGIMNLMLASITERVREIGIRKAIGARDRDIFIQFVVESVTLSTFGGLLGLGAGAGGIALLQNVLPEASQPTLSAMALTTGFIFSAICGVVAGIYPAFQAARLDPIEALRHE